MGVDPRAARAHLERRQAERREAGLRRAERLRSRLPEAARCLHERYGAKRAQLFGSLAARAAEVRDVDIAVEGLAPERTFAALADLMQILGAPVDLVRIEEAPPSLRTRIREDGVEL